MRWSSRSTRIATAALASILLAGLWAGWSMHQAQLEVVQERHVGEEARFVEARAALERANWISTGAAAATGLLVLVLAGMFSVYSANARHERESSQRRSNTFEGSPVALWEEDFSAVGSWIESLRASGVTDLRTHFADQPDALDHGIGLVRVLAVNAAGRRMIDSGDTMFLFGSESGAGPKEELRDSMTEQFVAIWDNQSRFEVLLSGTTTGGRHLDGVLYWQAAQFADGRLDLSKVMVAIVDVTERVAAEQKLVRVVDNRERLIAAISHELRTPLTSVIGFLLILEKLTAAKMGSEERFMLAAATQEAEHLGSVVEDLLIAAHHGIGRIPVRQVPVVMQEIMQQTAAATFSGRPADGALDFEVEPDLVALADPVRVRQVLRNLLTNAVRYGGDVRRVAAFGDGSDVVVQVMDSGQGVGTDRVDALFEPYRPSAVNPNMPGSLGLGLAISRTLARAMGGDLTYRRTESETVFELRLTRQAPFGVSAARPELGESLDPSQLAWAKATIPALFDDSSSEILLDRAGTGGVRASRRAEHHG